jgi:hypothetical protein
MGAATPYDRTLNCRTTTATRFAGALINIKTLLHLAVAIWCRVVVDRGSAGSNGLAQHADDREVQRVNLNGTQRARRGERMDLCAPECLVGVDVADAHDAALVKKKALDARPTMRNE